ncbi:unnamed protein product [Heligmosomoides polygyrus]|uniref:RT_RNaseH domain-containing protein n=1 Tax=Heligmosomoides polygyrus TaxID=6339 RepID=A0A183GX08_HELPZ|nr:unnamed protein product [Heligmosomoides polygyrus]
MREVVTQKLSWNKPLDKEYVSRWKEICAEIRGTAIKIPRNIAAENRLHNRSTLWIFGDASQVAIACCSYVTYGPDHNTNGLLCAKARLAPLRRKLSIPRLELLALLISLRLANSASAPKTYSDSNQVDRIHKITRQIQDLGITVELNYIESEHNPADVATRPTSREQFEESQWLTGPKWLAKPEHEWPIESTPKGIVEEDTEDIVEENRLASCSRLLPLTDLYIRKAHKSLPILTLLKRLQSPDPCYENTCVLDIQTEHTQGQRRSHNNGTTILHRRRNYSRRDQTQRSHYNLRGDKPC